jgi:hypothetical protein
MITSRRFRTATYQGPKVRLRILRRNFTSQTYQTHCHLPPALHFTWRTYQTHLPLVLRMDQLRSSFSVARPRNSPNPSDANWVQHRTRRDLRGLPFSERFGRDLSRQIRRGARLGRGEIELFIWARIEIEFEVELNAEN